MSVHHKADPGELIQWVTHESWSSAASNSGLIRIGTQPRTADAWHQWLMPAARRRHPRFFGHFWPSVWPSSRSNFDLGPSPLDSTEKNLSYQSLWFWSAVFLALFDPSSNTRVLSGVEVRSQSWWSCKNRSAAAIMLCFRLWKNDLTTIRSSYFTRLSQIWPPPIWLSCCHHHRTTLDIPLEKNCTLSLLLKNRPPSLVFCHARLFFGIAYRQNCRRAPLLARLSQL